MDKIKELWQRFIDGENGISHGVLTAAVIAVVWWVTYSFWVIVFASVITAYYWAQREASARGTWRISEWYHDSKMDAIVPAIVAVVAIVLATIL